NLLRFRSAKGLVSAQSRREHHTAASNPFRYFVQVVSLTLVPQRLFRDSQGLCHVTVAGAGTLEGMLDVRAFELFERRPAGETEHVARFFDLLDAVNGRQDKVIRVDV